MIAFLFATLLAAAAPLPAVAQEVHAFNVSTQDPATAIRTFGAQAEIQILASADDLKGKKFNPVTGEIPTEEALNDLLKGTGLDHTYVGERAVALVSNTPATAVAGNSAAYSSPPAAGSASNPAGSALLAQAGSPPPSNTSGGDQQINPSAGRLAQTPDNNKLEEIVVTAQKREERLQNVPIPISVLNASVLTQNNQLRIEDYAYQVPGLTTAPASQNEQIIAIRGVNDGGNSPTVAITIDGIPVGSVLYSVAPDIDPSDLSRIEVLRGPQGTLYGVSSIGGLVNYVTPDPSTDKLGGRIEAGLSSVSNGAEQGYTFRGAVNVPVTDNFAIRLSGFTRQDPGYIDNPTHNLRGVNEDHVSGGHLSALWTPTSDLSVKLIALFQDFRGNGVNDVLPDGTQPYAKGTGWNERTTQVYGVFVTDKIGDATLTSITAYNIITSKDINDLTPAGLAGAFAPNFGVDSVGEYDVFDTRKFSQEFRLQLPFGRRFDALFGAFYSYESSPYWLDERAINGETGITAGDDGVISFPTTYAELAGFADLTYHVTDSVDVQVGGRGSHIRQTYDITYTGGWPALVAQLPTTYLMEPKEWSTNNPFNYLFTPQWKISPDIMAYVRLASGYRAGGPNAAAPGVPQAYGPDKTYSYDIGTKASFFDHRLYIDVAAFYIDWKNIIVSTSTPPPVTIGYMTNAGRAKSEGVEASFESHPFAGMKLSGWVDYTEAVLTEGFANFGNPGDRLPFSPRWSGYLAAQQDFPITNGVNGFVGASVNYQTARTSYLMPLQDATINPGTLPPYGIANLQAGVNSGPWSVHLYANNIANRTPRINWVYSLPPYGYMQLPPRNIGLSVARSF